MLPISSSIFPPKASPFIARRSAFSARRGRRRDEPSQADAGRRTPAAEILFAGSRRKLPIFTRAIPNGHEASFRRHAMTPFTTSCHRFLLQVLAALPPFRTGHDAPPLISPSPSIVIAEGFARNISACHDITTPSPNASRRRAKARARRGGHDAPRSRDADFCPAMIDA